MVHLTPPGNWRRRIDLIVGGVLGILGVVVAVVAITALHQPNGHESANVRVTGTITVSATPSTPAATSSGSASQSPKTSASTSKTTAKTTASSSTAASTSGVKSVPLVVLNVTSRTGLAATAAKTFEAGGWTVTSEGNLSNSILSTCAYYDPSDPANLSAANALMAQFPAIKRVKQKFDGLPAGPIVVVLTDDYS